MTRTVGRAYLPLERIASQFAQLPLDCTTAACGSISSTEIIRLNAVSSLVRATVCEICQLCHMSYSAHVPEAAPFPSCQVSFDIVSASSWHLFHLLQTPSDTESFHQNCLRQCLINQARLAVNEGLRHSNDNEKVMPNGDLNGVFGEV